MTSPGALTRRGAAGLRLDDQHTVKIRVPAARLYVAGTTQEASKEEGKKKMATGCS
jgi:ketosteroid isomerase-like protein